jgi:hypothetical protein
LARQCSKGPSVLSPIAWALTRGYSEYSQGCPLWLRCVPPPPPPRWAPRVSAPSMTRRVPPQCPQSTLRVPRGCAVHDSVRLEQLNLLRVRSFGRAEASGRAAKGFREVSRKFRRSCRDVSVRFGCRAATSSSAAAARTTARSRGSSPGEYSQTTPASTPESTQSTLTVAFVHPLQYPARDPFEYPGEYPVEYSEYPVLPPTPTPPRRAFVRLVGCGPHGDYLKYP